MTTFIIDELKEEKARLTEAIDCLMEQLAKTNRLIYWLRINGDPNMQIEHKENEPWKP